MVTENGLALLAKPSGEPLPVLVNSGGMRNFQNHRIWFQSPNFSVGKLASTFSAIKTI
jgi:hypothetical protein